eukprot:68210-Prorocentrum_minimum.AAC.2
MFIITDFVDWSSSRENTKSARLQGGHSQQRHRRACEGMGGGVRSAGPIFTDCVIPGRDMLGLRLSCLPGISVVFQVGPCKSSSHTPKKTHALTSVDTLTPAATLRDTGHQLPYAKHKNSKEQSTWRLACS